MFSVVKSVGWIVFAIVIASPTVWADSRAVASVDEAIKAIRAQEDAVHTLRIQGEWKQSSWVKGAWAMQRDQQAVVIYDGIPATKMRIDCEKDLAPWEGGAGPFYFQAFTTIYNGRLGLTLKTREGTPDKPVKISDILLSHGPPTELYDASSTSAWRYTIFGNQAADKTEERQFSERFSKFLERHKDSAIEVTDGGVSLLKLTVKGRLTSNDVEKTYWLDPARGYSIIKYQGCILPDRTQSGTVRISDFYMPVANVYYPKAVDVESGRDQNGSWIPSQHNVIEISNVDVNSPEIKDDTFKLPIPSHSSILDQETGDEVPVAGTAEEQGRAIQREVDDAKRLMKEGEVHDSSPNTSSATTPSK